MVFPLGFFEHFKKNEKEKTSPAHDPQFPLSAFETHKRTADQEFAAAVLKRYRDPIPPKAKRPEEP